MTNRRNVVWKSPVRVVVTFPPPLLSSWSTYLPAATNLLLLTKSIYVEKDWNCWWVLHRKLELTLIPSSSILFLQYFRIFKAVFRYFFRIKAHPVSLLLYPLLIGSGAIKLAVRLSHLFSKFKYIFSYVFFWISFGLLFCQPPATP